VRPYTVIRPANHYPSRLPEYGDAPVVKLVTPRLAPARIGQYLIALPPGGGTVRPAEPGFETFFYALGGDAVLRAGEEEVPLGAGHWAYLPEAAGYDVHAITGAALLAIKRRYQAAPGLVAAPGPRHGHRDDQPWAETAVQGFRRRELLPVDDPAWDFAMSLLAFDAGVGLPNIEIHDEEHGLFMTAGGGDYHLDGDTHPVTAGDFIYMAPYCAQGFTATEASEYLLYKDTWRDGF
jgi:(S)-ureidoglycine aminohydrolase